MSLEHIIDEQATIKGADIEKVYENCLAWLKKIRARIKLLEKPKLIQAYHDTTTFDSLDTPDEWAKNVTIRLKHIDDEVLIHVIMDSPHIQPRTHVMKSKAYWPLLVEKLWKDIGVEVNNDLLLNLYPVTILSFILNDLKYQLITTFFVISSPLIIVLFLGTSLKQIFSMLGLLLFITLLLIKVGGIEYLYVRKMLRKLYPDR